MATNIKAKVVVLGSGPGGYTAAFRAADLGLGPIVLIERYENIGGVCLNVGCIPSKALLHVAEVIKGAKAMEAHGVSFGKVKIDLPKIKQHKDEIVTKLTSGLKQLAKQRKIEIVQGVGTFSGPNTLEVVAGKKKTTVEFEHAIIAVGSRVIKLPFLPEDDRILDSTSALELKNIPKELLVIGGGIIGMEMAEVYSALGSNITVVELTDSLLAGADKDIAKTFHKYMSSQFKQILLNTKVSKVQAKKDGIYVDFDGEASAKQVKFDGVLAAVGRAPNGDMIGAENAGIKVDARGFIQTDSQQRTNIPHIFAIGDVAGGPMLAHKAIPEGRVAAEVISGKKHYFSPACIPAVAYTNPEVSWVGLTEAQAQEQGIAYAKGVFPWAASGRSLSVGRSEGMTKLLFDKQQRLIGASVIGPHAGDLISELALAIEMGCEAEDLSLTVHPHPTFSETIAMAAEDYAGTITDLMPKKKKDK